MNKKAGVVCLLMLVCVMVCLFMRTNKKNDFDIYNTYVFQDGDNKRDVTMNVIINITEYNPEEIFERINEEADILLIRLYNNKDDFKNHKYSGEKEFVKD